MNRAKMGRRILRPYGTQRGDDGLR